MRWRQAMKHGNLTEEDKDREARKYTMSLQLQEEEKFALEQELLYLEQIIKGHT